MVGRYSLLRMLQLTQQGFAEEEADELLQKSFGWRGQVSVSMHVLRKSNSCLLQHAHGNWPCFLGVAMLVVRNTQAYWRKQRVKEVPAPEQLDSVLSFLAEQGVQYRLMFGVGQWPRRM